MTDYDKVKHGLECMADSDSGCRSDCPYYKDYEVNCAEAIAADALALIEAQREELRKLQRGRNWAPRGTKGVKITVNVCPTERFTRGGKPWSLD